MKWKQTTLGGVSSNIQTGPFGSQLHQSDYSETGIPVVMPKDLFEGKIVETSIARVDESHIARLSRHKIMNGDILYSRRGDIGRCAYATEKEAGWLCGTGCLRVTVDTEKVLSRFIFYQLQLPQTIGWVEKHAIGSTMLNLNTSILSSVPVAIPTRDIQEKIVDILRAYDNLIENNQEQIKLLEEAARRLYQEWFVGLRFPGHENTPIVDGVPEKWKYGKLLQIAEFKRGKTITKAQSEHGNVPVVAGGLEPAYYHNQANTHPPVITISGSGANAGFTRMYHVGVFASDCSFADINSTPYVYFVYCFLKDIGTQLNSLQKGSAQPHVYAKDINALSLLIPDSKYLEMFCKTIGPFFSKVQKIEKQIELAAQARDRLLPKLMSGEIET